MSNGCSDSCAVSTTGHGEAIMKVMLAREIAAEYDHESGGGDTVDHS